MRYGLRKRAAEHIESIIRNSGRMHYSYSTIYNRLVWCSLTDAYYFEGQDERYSVSVMELNNGSV